MNGHTLRETDWSQIIRPNILKLKPYRCARDDYSSGVLLDANENAFGHSIAGLTKDTMSLHRYPDPSFPDLKQKLADLRGFKAGHAGVFLGVGSDEVIDLLIRITCRPEHDSILVCPPTYGMYAVCAEINDVFVIKVPLDQDFQPDIAELSSQQPKPKIVFVTSPGNPTGVLVPPVDLKSILEHPTWRGLLVVDEAYIDFCRQEDQPSAVQLLNQGYQNLVVMQTLSKGFGLAGIRFGFCMCDPALAKYLSNTKAPYNISSPTASLALQALSSASIKQFRQTVSKLLMNRAWLVEQLTSSRLQQAGVGRLLGRPDANFIMAVIVGSQTRQPDNDRAHKVYIKLAETKDVVVRYRGSESRCQGCLRITIGTDQECRILIDKLLEALVEIQ